MMGLDTLCEVEALSGWFQLYVFWVSREGPAGVVLAVYTPLVVR